MKIRYPTSTYRLQLNHMHTLREVISHIDYFNHLGISDLYLSPITKATPESLHGYDVVDDTLLNPEIGTESELEELSNALKKRGMGLILDIVPNHMCITSDQNLWWQDLLAHGQDSKYAHFFDIDWNFGPADLKNKVLLPFLDCPLEEAIANGRFQVTEEGMLAFGGMHFPLRPDRMDLQEDIGPLIEAQHYRPDYWKRGVQEVNYRRFFHISELACVRVEEPEVFDAVHATVLRWVQKGWVTGLRIDHVDGLTDPLGYLERLHEATGGIYTVVEKILAEDEVLRKNWPVQGTTGYEFTNLLNQMFVDRDNAEAFDKLYRKFTGWKESIEEIIYASKEKILMETMQPEEKRICKEAPSHLHAAIHALIVAFPCYRTYIREQQMDQEDQEVLERAFADAKKLAPDIKEEVWKEVFQLFQTPSEFLIRFQQTTGPVMAKGYEDTALYRFFPLSSLNEVGSEIQTFGLSLKTFHETLQNRSSDTLSATTTHDTKRSEDVRAAIHVLSEMPQEWEERIGRWQQMNAAFSPPDPNDEYLLYQTLVGMWEERKEPEWRLRIEEYLIKAAREEKRRTDWIAVDEGYEKTLRSFVQQVLHSKPFLRDFETLMEKIAPAMQCNIMSQVVLKLTAPGIPDLYQGCEKPSFTLVDPDNRRPVVFETKDPSQKEQVTQKLLQIRREEPTLFHENPYLPFDAGDDEIIAFTRGSLFVCAGRFFLKNPKKASFRLPEGEWADVFSGEKKETVSLDVKHPFAVLKKL